MDLRKFFLITALIVSPALALAQNKYSADEIRLAKSAIESGLKSNLAYELVESLTTKIGPRPAGSSADIAAVRWAEEILKSWELDRVYLDPVPINAWIRGIADVQVLDPYPQPLYATALGNSVSTDPDGLIAPVVYFRNLRDLTSDRSNRAVGKIVFIDEHMVRTPTGEGYGQAVQARLNGAIESAKKGALAVLIRSIGTDSVRLPHTGTMNYQSGIKKIPALAVSNPDADQLVRMFESHLQPSVKIIAKNTILENQTSYNVIAEIRGSTEPDQIVAIGAHLDSWDLGTGAIDDGAGVGITMATLKILNEQFKAFNIRPKRTLRLILFANEENGLDGAINYNEVHGHEFHQLVSESDLGTDEIYSFDTRVDEIGRSWLYELKPLYESLNIEWGDNNGGTGSDLGYIARRRGYAEASLNQSALNYFDYHHTANDTLDKINKSALKQNVAAWSALVWYASQAGVDFH